MLLADLIKKLGAAKEGSRKLGDEVLLICGWKTAPNFDRNNPQPYWIRPDGQNVATNRPDPTTSLDAALTLLPKGYGAVSASINERAPHSMRIGHPYTFGNGPTPALALCIAALRAREAAR